VAPDARHLEHGAAAEALASRYLESRGLALVTANFRARVGELDLVMTEHGVLVVVEVRARRQTTVATPAATVNRGKQRRLVRTTQYFLLRHRQFARWPVRFDVVSITGELSSPEILWTRGAFTLDDVAAR
jgi:putative endonuclease